MTLDQWAAGLVHAQVPFKAHGRSREGLDCWGLVCLGYKEVLGKTLPGYLDEYDGVKDFAGLHELFDRHRAEDWVEVDRERAGDAVLLRLRGRPIHVGLVIGEKRMIHIEEKIQVCVERYDSAVWRNRVLGFYRPIGT